MPTHTPASGPESVVASFPTAPAEPQTLSPSDLKELVTEGLKQWGDVTRTNAGDREHARAHELDMARLELSHAERENDAERAVEVSSRRQSLYGVLTVAVLMVVLFAVLLFTGHTDLATQVLTGFLLFASGIGVGQTRTVRALLGERRPHKSDEDSDDERE